LTPERQCPDSLMMRGRRLSRFLWMATVVPLFVAAVLPSHVSTFACRSTGVMMQVETCCPGDEKANRHPQSRLRDEACCSITTIDLARLVSNRPTETPFRQHEVSVKLPATAVSVSPAGLALIRYVAPHNVGPPILLLKRSFLI
jgi:hypothetical protein